jgi:hypothetical protein
MTNQSLARLCYNNDMFKDLYYARTANESDLFCAVVHVLSTVHIYSSVRAREVLAYYRAH